MVLPKRSLYGDDVRSSEITPMRTFLEQRPTRRGFLAKAGVAAAAGMLPRFALGLAPDNEKLQTVPGKYQATDEQTPFTKATSYNNFYEFGVDKDLPAKNAHTLRTRPWPIKISGMVKKQQTINVDDLIHYRPIESRVYRHRCVEAWSMVIPWDGYSLSEFINFCEPLPGAKYVQFLSLNDRKQMPEMADGGYDWPYSEGLRMDEAMHPLTLLTFGCYGQVLPNQNGAPVRIVLPWKWGYKSAKDFDIDEIDRLAKAATQGLWEVSELDSKDVLIHRNPRIVEILCETLEDAAYIARMDPPTVLALVARIREMEAESITLDEGTARCSVQAKALWKITTEYYEDLCEAETARAERAEADRDRALEAVKNLRAPWENVKRQADAHGHEYARGHSNGILDALNEILAVITSRQASQDEREAKP